MYGVHKVLVGVDLVCTDDTAPTAEGPLTYELPPPTAEAVELALRIGERTAGSSLVFLSVVNDTRSSDDDDSVQRGVQAALDDLQAKAEKRGVEATTRIVHGRAWIEIIQEVLREQHDMVIVGSRQHRTRELLLGTTGTKLLRKCPCPVWVARPGAASVVPTIVVADDLTEVGAHCVQLGISAAQLLDGRVIVAHAVQYPLESALRRSGCPQGEIDAQRIKEDQAAAKLVQEHLAQTDHRALDHGVVVEIIHGPPDVVIDNLIDERQADLLVMGTVARSGIPGLLVGNTAERLLPLVECSVLALKPEGFESPVTLD